MNDMNAVDCKEKPFYFYMGVSLWVSMCDGINHGEKIAIQRRLQENFPQKNLERQLDELIIKFQEDFIRETQSLSEAIKCYDTIDKHKDELLKFARLALRDDNILSEQEEFTIAQIEKVLG